MRNWFLTNRQQIYIWGFGTSIVLFAFNGFLGGMYIGLAISILLLFYIFLDDEYRKKITLGSPFIYVPLMIISASIISSGLFQYVGNHELNTLIARIVLGIYLFLMYLVARIFGKDLLKPFAWAAVIEALSIIIYGWIIRGGTPTGGLAAPPSFDKAPPILIFCALVSISNKQWIVVSLSAVGLFLCGSTEGIIACGIIFIVMLLRRDYDKRILIPIISILVILGLGIPFKYDNGIYYYQIHWVENYKSYNTIKYTSTPDYVTDGRIQTLKNSIINIQWGGSGFVINPTDVKDKPVYNAVLVAMQQTGVWSGLAWLFLVLYCLFKTKWKYAWFGVIVLSLLDYYMFDNLGVWVFVLAGVSAVSIIENDLLFRKVKDEKAIQAV